MATSKRKSKKAAATTEKVTVPIVVLEKSETFPLGEKEGCIVLRTRDGGPPHFAMCVVGEDGEPIRGSRKEWPPCAGNALLGLVESIRAKQAKRAS